MTRAFYRLITLAMCAASAALVTWMALDLIALARMVMQ
jgi:hypothetical protein